jgi:undecaprenyl phosphate N,N'-diacetylbacillosamine 1-phosphate transferase
MYVRYVKRLLDIAASLILLPFMVIAILVMAPIIYIDDPGPVFYNAPRRGKGGRVFTMFKLRSMRTNAPDLRNPDGSTFSSGNDPRLTRVGRLMRKLSIDELPQILNVLLGDMSFVGPRPTLPTTPYEKLSDLSKARLAVRPGITGYAQAYYRNSITQEEKFRYDCYYIENISFVMDLKILVRTAMTVLARRNINSGTGPAPTRTAGGGTTTGMVQK